MNPLRTWFHVHRWNLWRRLDWNERAWMRCMKRQIDLERRIAELEAQRPTPATDVQLHRPPYQSWAMQDNRKVDA